MSKLGYSFAPIDIQILSHPKMKDACAPTPEHPGGDMRPFGLWCWCVTFVTGERTRGRVTRGQIRSAPGGLDNDEVAVKLVASGLLIALEDGTFEVFNHAKKLPKPKAEGERSPEARRQAEYMERLRQAAEAARIAGLVPPPAVTDTANRVTDGVTDASVSNILRSSGSLEVLEEPTQVPRAIVGPPANDDDAMPPERVPWSQTSGDLAQQHYESALMAATKGDFIGLGSRAAGHRQVIAQILDAKTKGLSKADALKWLEKTIHEWVAAEGGKSAVGWEPAGLRRWLAGGRKAFAQKPAPTQRGGPDARALRPIGGVGT